MVGQLLRGMARTSERPADYNCSHATKETGQETTNKYTADIWTKGKENEGEGEASEGAEVDVTSADKLTERSKEKRGEGEGSTADDGQI